MAPAMTKNQQIKCKGKTSAVGFEPASDSAAYHQGRSGSGKTPHQSFDKPSSSSNEYDTDSDIEPAVKNASRKRVGGIQPKNAAAPASTAEHVKDEWLGYSFGKRENIISGREPKLPRSLLEGRCSGRMLEIKGRTYNKEDWFDDSDIQKKGEAGDSLKLITR